MRLRRLDRAYRDENEDRRERLTADPATPVALVEAPSGFKPPDPWMRSTPNGRYRVRYRYAADMPGMRYLHKSDTPADLVRFMRDAFRGNEFLIVIAVFEVEA